MAAQTDYEIGATVPGLQKLWPTLAVNPPRGRYFDAAEFADKSNGQVVARGFPMAIWEFSVLKETMVSTLRGYVGTAQSATIFIKTRVPPDSASSVEVFKTFQAIMVWPGEGLMRQRNFNGRYLDIAIEFRQLVEQ
jgi:hypothetical protein